MPMLSPEGTRTLATNVLASAAKPAPPANPQVRHREERGSQPNGANPAPTRAPLAARSASPSSGYGSGIESAMGAMADKLHPTKGGSRG